MKKIKSLAFGLVLELNKIIKIIFLFICINSKVSYFKNFNQLPRGKPTRHSKETNLIHFDVEHFDILRTGSGE